MHIHPFTLDQAVAERQGRVRRHVARSRRAGGATLAVAALALGGLVAQLVRRCGARTPGLLRGGGVEPLTAREREVALLAAGGASSKDIAAQLYLSARTVDTHLARVYRKLGITGRDQLDAALRTLLP